MTFTEEEMIRAGFQKTVPHLPHVLAAYEAKLPNGNTVTMTGAGKDKSFHSATEFYWTPPLRMVAHYRVNNVEELAALAKAELEPFYKFK